MTFGWNERREFEAYVWRRLRAHERMMASVASEVMCMERVMANEMQRKNKSIATFNENRKLTHERF